MTTTSTQTLAGAAAPPANRSIWRDEWVDTIKLALPIALTQLRQGALMTNAPGLPARRAPAPAARARPGPLDARRPGAARPSRRPRGRGLGAGAYRAVRGLRHRHG